MNREDLNSIRLSTGNRFGYQATTDTPYGGYRAEIPVVVADNVDHELPAGEIHALDTLEYAHLRMFALGAYHPLTGFMNAAEIRSVLRNGCLPDFLPWEEPIFLATEKVFEAGSRVVLAYEGKAIAELKVSSQEPIPHELHTAKGVVDGALLGGDLVLFRYQNEPADELLQEWNALLDQSKQANNKTLRAVVVGLEVWRTDDEYLVASAVETNDQVWLHPVPRTEGDNNRLSRDIARAATDLVLHHHYAGNHLVPSPVPAELFATDVPLLHLAIIYQNLGCRRLLLASEDNRQFSPELSALDIETILLSPAFHCLDCGGHTTRKLCSHSEKSRRRLRESEVVKKLVQGEQLPPSVARPEVARMLSRRMSAVEGLGEKAANRRHVFPHASKITRSSRIHMNGHRSAVLWMTGLSGSGKSTLATHVERELVFSGHQVCVLDGDALRSGLCGDLDFSPEGRRENLRRAAETAKILVQNGMLVLASFISPFSNEREMLRDIIGNDFYEVYVEASLEDCEKRDPKGLYQRARAGLIPEFTGISSPYEEPDKPELRVNTSLMSIEEAVRHLMFEMESIGLLKRVSAIIGTSAPGLANPVFNPARRI